ncbi:MAG: hypothetical protein KDA79_07540 [Planctomycetaceae bacterium]|nr:hypothetical protein [Planctomycetaceae bacterium]
MKICATSRPAAALAAAMLTAAILALPAAAPAAPGHDHDHAGHSHEAGHDHPEILAFRLTAAKEQHFDDAARAEQHLQLLQRIGARASLDRHAGHIDVIYSCPEWRQLTVKTHDGAVRWAAWLEAAGFDVWHGHIDERLLHGPEAVEFRQAEWKTLHFDGRRAADRERIVTGLKQLGCEVREDRHGDHADVTFRCPIWSTIRVEDHATAERWLTWLEGAGFETRHTHPPAGRQSQSPRSTPR